MTKEEFLTSRWNNLLTVGGLLILLLYVILVFNTSLLSDLAGFIGLVVIGVLY